MPLICIDFFYIFGESKLWRCRRRKKDKTIILMAKNGKENFPTVVVSSTWKYHIVVIKLRLLNTPIADRYWFTLTDISDLLLFQYCHAVKTPTAQTLFDWRAWRISVRYESPLMGLLEQNLIASFNNTVIIR